MHTIKNYALMWHILIPITLIRISLNDLVDLDSISDPGTA